MLSKDFMTLVTKNRCYKALLLVLYSCNLEKCTREKFRCQHASPPAQILAHNRKIKLLLWSNKAVKGVSGHISKHTLSFKPRGDDSATTLMAACMAFRAERCDMQAFTLAACHTHLHTHSSALLGACH